MVKQLNQLCPAYTGQQKSIKQASHNSSPAKYVLRRRSTLELYYIILYYQTLHVLVKIAEIQRYTIIDLRLLRLQGGNSFTITICIIVNSTLENVHRFYR